MCPDGRSVLFTSVVTGASGNIWRIGTDGTNLKQLTQGSLDLLPVCSQDSKWVVFDSWRNATELMLWSVPTAGGNPTQLANYRSTAPGISPDAPLHVALHKRGLGKHVCAARDYLSACFPCNVKADGKIYGRTCAAYSQITVNGLFASKCPDRLLCPGENGRLVHHQWGPPYLIAGSACHPLPNRTSALSRLIAAHTLTFYT